jgi:hypothetical protein
VECFDCAAEVTASAGDESGECNCSEAEAENFGHTKVRRLWPKFSTSAGTRFESLATLHGRSRNFGGAGFDARVECFYCAAEVVASACHDGGNRQITFAEATNFGHIGGARS